MLGDVSVSAMNWAHDATEIGRPRYGWVQLRAASSDMYSMSLLRREVWRMARILWTRTRGAKSLTCGCGCRSSRCRRHGPGGSWGIDGHVTNDCDGPKAIF